MRGSRVAAVVSLVIGALAATLAVGDLLRPGFVGDWAAWPSWLPWAGLGLAACGLAAAHALERREHRMLHDTPACFLDPGDEARVVEAIRRVERRTHAELRVHLAFESGGDPVGAAARAFGELGMGSTRRRGGVLLYVAVNERRLAVIGDEGVDRLVEDGFWDGIAREVETAFARGERLAGLLRGIERIGEALAAHAPRDPDDENELPDGVSRSGR